MLITDLIIGLLLFICLRVAVRLIKIVPSDKPYAKTLLYLFPVLEFVLWTLFLFWVLFHLFKGQFYYPALITSLILVLVAFISWFVIKDFIAGLIFKAENTFRVNNVIKIAHAEGTIKRLGYLSLDLINENGELEKVRYSSLSGQKIVKPNPSEALKKFTFIIDYNSPLSESKTSQIIRAHVLNAPWSSTSKNPVIQTLQKNQNSYQFEVTVYTLNAVHADAIEEYLTAQLSFINSRMDEP